MTKLTQQLTNKLENGQNTELIKDEVIASWFTGRQLIEDVANLRQHFINLKVKRGDIALISLANSALYPILMQSLWELGVIAHPVAATTPLSQLQAEFNEYDYTLLIVGIEVATGIVNDAVLEETSVKLNTTNKLSIFVNSAITGKRIFTEPTGPLEEDVALILNTSGTTGKPKRVGLSHKQLYQAAVHNIASHALTTADTTMIVLPLSHINAQVIACLSTRLSGGKMVIAKKFSASHFWQQVSTNGVTWVSMVPTIISILLLNEKSRASYSQLQAQIRLRFIRSASFSLPEVKLMDFERQFHTRVIEGYGMTETAGQITLNPLDAPKIGSTGKAVATDIAILVDGQLETGNTRVGEIVLRGDHVISDYVDPHPESFTDGWLMTGDIGYLDEDGYLFVKGRIRDMINHGGEKVAPAEVESVLSELDLVADVAVIGLPDDLYGEAVTAVIKTKQTAASEFAQTKEVMRFVKKNLAVFEQPTRVYFVDKFPRNASGKVVRAELKKQLTRSMVGEKV